MRITLLGTGALACLFGAKLAALGPVTLGQLLATWAAHDLSHLGQVARVMAKRYRDAVGPWRAYLPILDR